MNALGAESPKESLEPMLDEVRIGAIASASLRISVEEPGTTCRPHWAGPGEARQRAVNCIERSPGLLLAPCPQGRYRALSADCVHANRIRACPGRLPQRSGDALKPRPPRTFATGYCQSGTGPGQELQGLRRSSRAGRPERRFQSHKHPGRTRGALAIPTPAARSCRATGRMSPIAGPCYLTPLIGNFTKRPKGSISMEAESGSFSGAPA
jgi:hypothetical protein